MCAGRTISIFLVSLLFFPLCATDVDRILADVRAGMGRVHTLTASFEQKKEIVSLRRTLTIRGTLALDKAGRMAWRVSEPIRYACVISGNRLTQWDAESGSELTLDTAKNPSLKILADSMTSYFSGDFNSMTGAFTVSAPGAYCLRFVPKPDAAAGAFIRELEFETAQDYSHITRVRILEKSGDVTAIRFLETRLNPEIPESVWRAKAQ